MSAPLTDLPPSSTSSSGLVDGLGRRALAFDRETGIILERLVLRPELAAFEAAIRERIELMAALDDERFARPGAVQRDSDTGDLIVVSEFVAGSRLSDLLESAEEAALIPGVDVALGFMLEALPAISTFHNLTGYAHGLIDPTRMVITPTTGQVVFLDAAYGPLVERLGLSRARLWSELGIAAPESPGPVRLDASGDISQLALSAVMLVLGRRIREDEYPREIPSLLMEVVEVAQIRGSSLFATSIQRLLQRALPLPGRRPFNAADELANEIRLLLRREIGADVCRQALLDFTQQMDAVASEFDDDQDDAAYGDRGESASAFGLDEGALGSIESFEILEDESAIDEAEPADEDDDADEYAEVSLDGDALDQPAALSAAPAADTVDRPGWSDDARAEEIGAGDVPPAEARAPDAIEPGPGEFASEAPEPLSSDSPSDDSEQHSSGSRRRKREHKSARARKDKLRSISRPAAPPPKPEPKPATHTGWIVSPDRAAAFAPPVPEAPPAAPAAGTAIPSPVVGTPMPSPSPAPVPLAPVPQPAPRMPVYGSPQPASAAPITEQVSAPRPIAAQPVRAPVAAGPVRLKNEPPPGYAPPRASQPAPPPMPVYGHRPVLSGPHEPAGFPWKLAAAAVLIVGIAVVAGRAYIPSGVLPDEPTGAATAPANDPPPAPAPPKLDTGDITLETQPSGARVLLDGKPVGETPLKLAGVPAGRHVLTFMSSAGEVTRTVRVAAGKTLELDVPIFSGWLAVFAPVVLEVAVNGKSLGTTEQSRLMIPPGRHELTLTNAELGYRAVQEVTVEPGEVRSVTVEPRGDANFNAVPWAEIWMDGQKLGDTPLGNMRVPLGTREFVFKHPQYGERKVTALIRADQPTPVSVDFTR